MLIIAPMLTLDRWMLRTAGCVVLCAALPRVRAQDGASSPFSGGFSSFSDEIAPLSPLSARPSDDVPTGIPVLESDEAPELWEDIDDIFEDLPEGGESSAAIEAAATQSGPGDVFQSLPTGYESPAGGYTPAPSRLAGWTFGALTSITYDSNAQQSPGGLGRPIESDWIFALTPSVGYRTVGGEWFFAANASVGWRHYFQTEPSDGYDIGMNFQVGYDGPKLDASLNVNYTFQEGYNRYYNSTILNNNFVAQQQLGIGMSGSYRMSSKTSMTASLNANGLAPSGTAYNNTRGYRANLGMRWKATGLTSLEGGISHSQQSGDRQFDRTTLGPYVGLDYKLAKKVALDARVGLDFVTSSGPGGNSDQFVPLDMGLTYNASALWGMNFSVFRDVNADQATSASYRERLGARIGYHRKIRRATLNLGAGYETNNYTGLANIRGNDSDYYNADASISMPVFANRANASLFLRYRNEESDSTFRNWDGYQIGMSLGASF